MSGRQRGQWELGARAVRGGNSRCVELTRRGTALVEMEPEEALALTVELCEAAKRAIFDRDEPPVAEGEAAAGGLR